MSKELAESGAKVVRGRTVFRDLYGLRRDGDGTARGAGLPRLIALLLLVEDYRGVTSK